MRSRLTIAAFVVALTGLSNWPAPAPASPGVLRALPLLSLADTANVPLPPKPFTLPAQPIVAASSDGYLPSSWTVTPKGDLAFTLPLAVPPGRAGMAPSLALGYASGSGNGLVGVGWSVTGFSTIARGGRVLARDGATDGVDYSVRDRFYLDGQELVGVTATPYGGNGAEYRTATDTFVRVHSTSSQALDPKGPEAFIVELGDGRVRTYAPVTGEQVTFDNANKVFAHGPVRVEWRIVAEQDAHGNAIEYEYQDTQGPGGTNAGDYWVEFVPSAIRYTANLTNGVPTHGLQDLPQRAVVFEYEPRPDVTRGWVAGVQRQRSLRLKTIRMDAPNPTATGEVWRYTLDYTQGGSQRSLLSSVERCENAGGCLWAKTFGYTPSTTGAVFQAGAALAAPIAKADYDLTAVAAPDGEVPTLQLLDLNGDAASDLMFGPGATHPWELKYYGAPFDVWVPDGKWLGTSHTLWLSARDPNGTLVPFAQSQTLARDEDPLATATYGHVRLDAATGVDVDGDGHDELVALIDNEGSHEVNVDPNLPPLYYCSYATLAWTGAAFVHTQVTPCTVLGKTNGNFQYFLPDEFPTYADLDGDGLPDRAWLYNTAGWIGSNNPNDKVQYEYDPAWQVALNTPATPGKFQMPVKYAKAAASPGVVTDLNGDGRAELTNEALKTSLALDDTGSWTALVPDSVHQPLDARSQPEEGYREFGDFNGDGTEDLLRLTQADPSRPGTLTAQVFWNTGKGFYADPHVATLQIDVHPDNQIKVPTRFADPGLHVTDVDDDGRMDVVVFRNDHKSASNQPAPEIEFLFSKGDGTFAEADLPVAAGTRDDVKYWLDNSLRSVTLNAGLLERDDARLALEAYGSWIPGAQVLLAAVPYQDYLVVGGDGKTPGLAAGWNLATLADTNGDGAIDIVRHVGGNAASGGFEVLTQVPHEGGDLLSNVTDSATAWPALSIGYSSQWTDAPELIDGDLCAYPLRCVKSGLTVVRVVTSRAGLTDVAPGQDAAGQGHTWTYAYRDPVANVQGLGFFGFGETRVLDTWPAHPVETITTYDLRTRDASGLYPGVGVPAQVTVAQPIFDGALAPSVGPARITESTYTYAVRTLNGGATHAVFTQAADTRIIETTATFDAAGQGPDHRHVTWNAAPPTLEVGTTLTFDDYGNVTDTLTKTTGGRKTEVQTPRLNDTVNWHLGLTTETAVMTLESTKNALATWQTTDYTYTGAGDLETIVTEPNSADPALQATTTFGYDDYGLPTTTTATTPGEAPRTQVLDYTNRWPGAPDEHLVASAAWSEHDNPLCSGDCRPAAWVLIHPAYGLPVATMDVNGVEARTVYDGHGRPVHAETDGTLPVDVTYAGRPDTYGGMNGLQATATQGGQEVLKTFDARGHALRRSFIGFDGQWINAFTAYDALGRPTATSRPSPGTPSLWTEVTYDSLGRAIATVYPDGSAIQATYGLLKTEHTDPAGHYGAQDYDVDGRLIASENTLPAAPGCANCIAKVIQTTYQYTATPTGPVTKVTDDQGHVTTTQYDRRGRPVLEDDPSTGTSEVTYNGFGEARQTVHGATGATETATYDDLGRTATTTTPDGLTTYTFDVALHGIGRLARAMSPDQIKTEVRYDAAGRTIGLDQTDMSEATALKLSIDLGYDAQTGRLARIDYPQAPSQAARLRAAYAYNAYGYLTSVTDATPGGTGTAFQEITARNADLALVDATRGLEAGVGGGAIDDHRDYDPLMGRLWTIQARHAGANRLNVAYGYDADGLVAERTTSDETITLDETFQHDALHRLTQATRHGNTVQNGVPFSTTLEESYDSLGNRIDTKRNGQLVEHRSYGSNGAQPYALTTRDLVDPSQPPQTLSYQYDALGRLTQDAHRAFAWTAFDLPSSVTEDGQTVTFRYDAAHTRVKKTSSAETVTMFAGLYEQHASASPTRHVFHVVGADEAVADVTYTESATSSQPGTTTVVYPLTDALGSTNAVADSHGTIAEHDYYDLWGLRSNADGTPLAQPLLFQSLVGAGFTSQPHDEDLALVNMQGRLYDPAMGRFLSPDPIVGNAAFGQSWNAYSYVNNSPVDFTDPSGFECTAGMAVANASEKAFIASGTCNQSNNYSSASGDEVTVSDASRVPAVASNAGAIISGEMAFMQEQARRAANEQQVQQVHKDAHGIPTKTADGTPVVFPLRYNDTNAVVDATGRRLYGPINTNPPLNYTNNPIEKRMGQFEVRLFCGTKCSQASAPTSRNESAKAPRQLSTPRILRNAVSQALAAKAVARWVGKVGVIIDEGVEGIIDRLTPDGMGMSEEDEKLVAQYLAKLRAQRARDIDQAGHAHLNKEIALATAIERRNGLRDQYLAAQKDLQGLDATDVGIDLFEKVALDARSEYDQADADVETKNFAAQAAFDYYSALIDEAKKWGDFDDN